MSSSRVPAPAVAPPVSVPIVGSSSPHTATPRRAGCLAASPPSAGSWPAAVQASRHENENENEHEDETDNENENENDGEGMELR